MAKISEWLGDDFSKNFITNDTNQKLIDFCGKHESVYIFGAGKVGKGIKLYLDQCEISVSGFVTSDTLDEFRKIYKQGEVGVVMGLNDMNLLEVLPLIKSFTSERDLFIAPTEYRERLGRFSAEHIRNNCELGVYIVSHCNMACKGCRTFSPINRPDYYEYTQYVNDMEQIKNLGLEIRRINISGGEPYLHPNLFEIFKITRKLFPLLEIRCYTNGMLLSKLHESQLKQLVDLDIITIITEYPLTVNINQSFYPKADAIGLKYSVVSFEKSKAFISVKLDSSNLSPKYDFYNCFCYHSSVTFFLFRGRIYGCGRPIFIEHINQRFNMDFKVRTGDYINIYNTTPEELYNFKVTRHPFCDYHNSENCSLFEWDISERRAEEWVL